LRFWNGHLSGLSEKKILGIAGRWLFWGGVATAAAFGGAAAATYAAAHPRRRPLEQMPDALGLPYEPVRFPARDGLWLSAWWVPAAQPETARAAVVLCHGYPKNRAQMLPCLPALHHAGYHALLFDFRALGESEGRRCGIGHAEVEDLLGAIEWLASRPEVSALPVAALGLSMGGAVAIMAAAECSRIAAVVADGAYPSLEQALHRRCRLVFGPLAPLVQPSLRRVWVRLHGAHPSAAAPERAIRRLAPRPVFLIHGSRDIYLSATDARALVDGAAGPCEFWHVDGVPHVRAHEHHTDEYMTRVIDFLQRHGL
jgi:fermentation-respiration switch protein FrsA (DUF1100 family)